MKKEDVIRTPSGGVLGRRITIEETPAILYKQGRHTDRMTIYQLVECIAGRKVEAISFCPDK